MPGPRLAGASLLTAAVLLAAPAAAQEEPGPPHTSNLVVGQAPPSTFILESIDGVPHDLAGELGQRPLLVLFFRGTW